MTVMVLCKNFLDGKFGDYTPLIELCSIAVDLWFVINANINMKIKKKWNERKWRRKTKKKKFEKSSIFFKKIS